MKKDYAWPASQLTDKEMELLYEERKKSKKPICLLNKEAIQQQYAKRKEL